MTDTEVDALARKKLPLPDDAGLCDMMLYRILSALYAEYTEGIISKNTAKVEKARAMEKHRELELQERIYKEHSKRLTELSIMASKAFNEHTCPLCVKMYNIFSGYRGRENNEENNNDV